MGGAEKVNSDLLKITYDDGAGFQTIEGSTANPPIHFTQAPDTLIEAADLSPLPRPLLPLTNDDDAALLQTVPASCKENAVGPTFARAAAGKGIDNLFYMHDRFSLGHALNFFFGLCKELFSVSKHEHRFLCQSTQLRENNGLA